MLGYGLMYGLKALVFALVLVVVIVRQSKTKGGEYANEETQSHEEA